MGDFCCRRYLLLLQVVVREWVTCARRRDRLRGRIPHRGSFKWTTDDNELGELDKGRSATSAQPVSNRSLAFVSDISRGRPCCMYGNERDERCTHQLFRVPRHPKKNDQQDRVRFVHKPTDGWMH